MSNISTLSRTFAARMSRVPFAGAALLAVVSAAPAHATPAGDCDAGIAMITSELAKQHPQKTTDALNKALRVAKREKGEQEYDECLDAVADAEKALKK